MSVFSHKIKLLWLGFCLRHEAVASWYSPRDGALPKGAEGQSYTLWCSVLNPHHSHLRIISLRCLMVVELFPSTTLTAAKIHL